MLEEENDNKPNMPENGGGGGVKIVRKLGKAKAAAGGTATQAYTKKVGGEAMPVPEKRGGGGGGFSENDIEFMKKAI